LSIFFVKKDNFPNENFLFSYLFQTLYTILVVFYVDNIILKIGELIISIRSIINFHECVFHAFLIQKLQIK